MREWLLAEVMKSRVLAVVCVLAVWVLVWEGRRFLVSPIGLFWGLPTLIFSVVFLAGAFEERWVRVGFGAGLLLVCLAFGGGVFPFIALLAGSMNLGGLAAVIAVVSGVWCVFRLGVADLRD
ncbi:MAG: hypothetical protein AAGC74_00535 [Verrucomicrobiota bacterium]